MLGTSCGVGRIDMVAVLRHQLRCRGIMVQYGDLNRCLMRTGGDWLVRNRGVYQLLVIVIIVPIGRSVSPVREAAQACLLQIEVKFYGWGGGTLIKYWYILGYDYHVLLFHLFVYVIKEIQTQYGHFLGTCKHDMTCYLRYMKIELELTYLLLM